MEDDKVCTSSALIILNWSSPNLVRLIISARRTHLPNLVKIGRIVRFPHKRDIYSYGDPFHYFNFNFILTSTRLHITVCNKFWWVKAKKKWFGTVWCLLGREMLKFSSWRSMTPKTVQILISVGEITAKQKMHNYLLLDQNWL